MKIYKMKKMSIPKVGVLVAGLTGAVLVATISPQAAEATPRAASCASCHAGATSATTTATPSTMMPAAGASYTVALTANPTGGNSGYGIVPVTAGTGSTFGGNTGPLLSYTATMTAPAAAGTYSYTVWTNQGPTSAGDVGSAVYTITVAGAPPVTTPPVTTPPVTTPPVTTPPVTTPPVTTPPVTTPPVTTPPVTTRPNAIAQIRSLSVRHGAVGSKVKIRGSGFGTAGTAQFGTTTAKVSSWTSTSIVVTVPLRSAVMAPSQSAVNVPVWYRHGGDFSLTVTPTGAAASNAVRFRLDTHNERGDHERGVAARRHLHDAGERR
jgi:hypothetical protein